MFEEILKKQRSTDANVAARQTQHTCGAFWLLGVPRAVPLLPPQSKALASLVSVEKYKMVPRTCNTEDWQGWSQRPVWATCRNPVSKRKGHFCTCYFSTCCDKKYWQEAMEGRKALSMLMLEAVVCRGRSMRWMVTQHPQLGSWERERCIWC